MDQGLRKNKAKSKVEKDYGKKGKGPDLGQVKGHTAIPEEVEGKYGPQAQKERDPAPDALSLQEGAKDCRCHKDTKPEKPFRELSIKPEHFAIPPYRHCASYT